MDQYLDILKRFTPSTLSQDHIAFLQDLERVAEEQPRVRVNVVDLLAQGDDVERKSRAVVIRQAEVAAAALRAPTEDAGVRIWSGPQADPQTISSNTKTSSVTSPMEKDFTALVKDLNARFDFEVFAHGGVEGVEGWFRVPEKGWGV